MARCSCRVRRVPSGYPRSETAPESGRSSPARHRATVVLPQPDSPTMPRVSPAATVKETSSTAVTLWPPPEGNETWSWSAASKASAAMWPASVAARSGGEQRRRVGAQPASRVRGSPRLQPSAPPNAPVPTGPGSNRPGSSRSGWMHLVGPRGTVGFERAERGPNHGAVHGLEAAPGGERAAGGRWARSGGMPGIDRGAGSARRGRRQPRAAQRCRGVPGRSSTSTRSRLNEFARVHYGQLVTDLAHDGQVVAHEHHRHAQPPAQASRGVPAPGPAP